MVRYICPRKLRAQRKESLNACKTHVFAPKSRPEKLVLERILESFIVLDDEMIDESN